MPIYSTDPEVHDFVAFLLRANERPNPFSARNRGHLIDREDIIAVVRRCLGEDAARTVQITLH